MEKSGLLFLLAGSGMEKTGLLFLLTGPGMEKTGLLFLLAGPDMEKTGLLLCGVGCFHPTRACHRSRQMEASDGT